MNLNSVNTVYNSIKETHLSGRYITTLDIEKCFLKLPNASISTLGYSVENRPIYRILYGNGSKKILMWSQMHGNESTTTKSLFDLFKFFESNDVIAKNILNSCTIVVIPILNPDGAHLYTRNNANDVDLNRDAQNLSQPESKLLSKLYKEFLPDYCLNLHGQRTIYNVGKTNASATLAFLAPSEDEERSVTNNRKTSMAIISKINEILKNELPGGIARYDDAYNLNCVGDTFQSYGVPTILYEAGHFSNDYEREEVRRFVFVSLLTTIYLISESFDQNSYKDYFEIPENETKFYDVIIRNARLETSSNNKIDIALQYSEELIKNKIEFVPIVKSISNLDSFFGHKEIDAEGKLVLNSKKTMLSLGNEIDFVMINNEKISLKP